MVSTLQVTNTGLKFLQPASQRTQTLNPMSAKVLILDTNKTDRDEVLKAMSPYECNIIQLETGEKAFDAIRTEKPDLVILDPKDLKDATTFEKIKADAKLRTIPIVITTLTATKEQVVKAAKVGIKDFLLKPIKPALLAERLERILELPRKTRSITDAVRMLVFEDKPLIIDQIKSICEGTPWEVLPFSRETDVFESIANQVPDIILVSLSLPNEVGFNFFKTLHADDRTKRVPVFGLCVKTAVEEQNRAQQDGMTGIVTKPIDVNDLKQRLMRALNVDTAEQYFSVKEKVLHVTFPATIDKILSEISPHVRPRISSMVDNGMNRTILDLSQVTAMDTNIIRLLIQVLEHCSELGVTYSVVGSAQMAAKAQAFEETKSITVYEDVDQALKAIAT
jgi:two-component system, cell cycle response regulator